jgi:hypothetical protein
LPPLDVPLKIFPHSVEPRAPCYIRGLPVELQSHIFTFVVEHTDHLSAIRAFYDLLSCMQTCGTWRAILLKSHFLWAELAVFGIQGMFGKFIGDFGLADSVSLSLDAVIPVDIPRSTTPYPIAALSAEYDDPECFHGVLFKAVLQALQHPSGHHRISIASAGFEELLAEMCKATAAPALTTLALNNIENPFLAVNANSVPQDLFARSAPSLRHLSLESFKDGWSSPLVNNLTTLHLGRSHGSILEQPALSAVLSALSMCPHLEVLHVSGCELPRHLGPARPTQWPELVVTLSRLQRLELVGTAYDMLALLLHLGTQQELADGISLTCVAQSSPQMVRDIFAYVVDKYPGSSDDQFESLEFVTANEFQFRLARGTVGMTVLVDTFAGDAHMAGIIDALPLADVKELYMFVPRGILNVAWVEPGLWQLLLRHLPALEWMSVPGHKAAHLSSALLQSRLEGQPPHMLVPGLGTIILEWPIEWIWPSRGPKAQEYLQKTVSAMMSCIDSRKDAEGVRELEVYLLDATKEEGEEESLQEYMLQFASEV